MMVERLNWRTIISAADDTPANIIAALDRYFERYVALAGETTSEGRFKVNDEQPCVGCGVNMTPGLMGLITKGGFEWGLVHGEGRCSACGWPASGHHFVRGDDGKEIMTLRNFVLQYHPAEVTTKESGAAA